MVYDLESEREVIKAFFARSIGWVAREVADESTRLAVTGQPDDELIEQVVTDPRGAEVLEQIILRAVINELSSLYEFALQQAWIRLSGLNVPIGKGPRYDENELVFVANRGRVEKALSNYPEPAFRPGSRLTALKGGVSNRSQYYDEHRPAR